MGLKTVMASMALVAFAPAASAGDPQAMVKIGGEGKVCVVNACEAPTAMTEASLKKLGNLLMIDFEMTKGAWTLATSQKDFEVTRANAAVFIVKDAALPMSLVAMEAKWGVVNAEGLDESGVSKEVLRVMTIILGGASSKYTASTMRAVFSADDLARKAGELVTFDSIMSISSYLPELGIKPYQMMSREDAIAEGLIEAKDKAGAKK